jgi:solute carrier family 35, member E4
MLSNAAMMSTSGRVLSEKLDVVRLTFYTAPVSCAALAPFFCWREVRCSFAGSPCPMQRSSALML